MVPSFSSTFFHHQSTFSTNPIIASIISKLLLLFFINSTMYIDIYDERNNLHDHVINRHHRSSLVVMALSTP